MHDGSDTPKCTLLDACDITCAMISNQHSRVKLLSCTPTATVVTTTLRWSPLFGSLHSSNLASRATATYHYVHCSTHVNLHVLCRTINIVVSCCCSRRQRHCGGAARQLFLTVFVVTAVQIGTIELQCANATCILVTTNT